MHSIRKGASTFFSSAPGGPPAAAICVRAGWTMGRVRDIYIKYEAGGDQFCGRALSMLPLLKPELGASLPDFSPECPRAWISTTIAATYPMIVVLESQRRLLELCLAQLVFHKGHIELWDENHIIRSSCQLFRDDRLTATSVAHTRVLYPWTAGEYTFSGIPPHVAVLHEIRVVSEQQRDMVEQILGQLIEILDHRGIAGGTMTEERLRDIVVAATQDIRDQMNVIANQGVAPGAVAVMAGTQLATRRYALHTYGGRIHLLPLNWRFPSVGVLSLWQQWLLGDYTHNVPPLRIITGDDVKHLDNIDSELGKQPGPAHKILCDLKYLMAHVELLVREAGAWTPPPHNATTVASMFSSVEHFF